MDEKLLREIRHRAVDEGLSLSAFIVRELDGRMRPASGHTRARALRLLDKPVRLKGALLSREALHER